MAEKPPVDIKPHPTRGSATRQIIGGVVAIGLGVAGAASGAWAIFWSLLPLGALLIGLGAYTRTTGAAVQALNKAVNLSSTGQLAEALALFEYVERTSSARYVLRAADFGRAAIAMRRGDFRRALEHVNEALARPFEILPRQVQRVQVCQARAFRAFFRASLGERDGAREDIAWIRAAEDALPVHLAHAALAEAMLLERAGDHAGLRDVLARDRVLLLEHTSARERAIVRAYQRMVRTTGKTRSVYRESAPKEVESTSGEPTITDWIATVAPSAAPFVRATGTREGRGAGSPAPPGKLETVPAGQEAWKAAEERFRAPRKSARSGGKIVLVWIVLIMMFLAIWQFLSPAAPGHVFDEPVAEEPTPFLMPGIIAFLLVMVVGFVAVQLRRFKRAARAILRAQALIARGDQADGVSILKEVTKGRLAAVAAEAHLALAQLAERNGDLTDALRECEAGIAKFPTARERAAVSDILFPGLLAQRAALFAAEGRLTDASAELGLLAETSPSFYGQSSAEFRVALLQKARQGDFEGAARLADQNADLKAFARDEILSDLSRAIAHPQSFGVEEIEQLEAELRDSPEVRRWIAAVAPGVLDAFAGARREAHAAMDAIAREGAAVEEASAEEQGAAPATYRSNARSADG